MGDVVNLRQLRKQRDRAADERKAEENRIHFGRTKAQKQADARNAEREAAHIDGHRREP